MAEAEAATGPTDILVNAAGTTAEQPVCGHSDELWAKIVDTNLTGAFRMTRAVLPGMIGRRWGRIVNIGSTAASVGWKDNPAYCASKAGLLGLTRCVALEGAAARRHLRHDQPDLGGDRTDAAQYRASRGARRHGAAAPEEAMAEISAVKTRKSACMQPDEIAALAVFLCGDAARGITMENIQVTGGALW